MTHVTTSISSSLRLLAVLVPMAASAAVHADVDVAWVAPTRGVSIALDASDNCFTLDYLYELGGDVTLTKRDSNGGLLWESTVDNTQSPFWERAQWVTTDSQGNALVCATRMSGYSNPVVAASVVMKFSAEGELLWRHLFDGAFDGSSTRKVLVDADDNAYVLGIAVTQEGQRLRVKKFAPDGAVIWDYLNQAGIGAPINFKFTPDNHLAITGRALIGSINGYAKINLDGQEVWSLPGVQSLTVGDCGGDAFGNTYVVHGEYVNGGGTVIRKLDPSGAAIWQYVYAFGGSRIEVGSDHQAVVSGFPNYGTAGAAFLKVDQDGTQLWVNLNADGPLMLLLHAQMLMDENNNAYLAAGTLFDMAVCKVNADGTSGWTGTTSGGFAQGMALGNDGRSVFMVGGATSRLIDDTPVPADLSGDGVVDGADLGMLLSAWGTDDAAADLNGDGVVDGSDLGELLSSWTGM